MAIPGAPANDPAHEADDSRLSRPRFTTVVVGLAASLLCLVLLREFAHVIGPLFLALNLMITAYPLHTWLVRKGTPSWLSAIVLALTVFAVLLAIVVGLIWSITEMIAILPQYSGEFTLIFQQGLDLALRLGFDQPTMMQLFSTLDPTRVLGAATSVVSGTSGAVALIGVVVIAIFFMAMDTPGMSDRTLLIAQQRGRIGVAMTGFARGVRRYWVVTTLFGIIVAVFDGIALALMGVPLALVWALFSFLTNYIPNIGFVIGLIPPAVVALFANGWQTAVGVIVVYSVLNFVIQSIIQPRFAGESVGVTATVSFLSLLVWTAVIGGFGTLLALPLTLLVKSLLIDADPRARWINAFISSDPREAQPEDPRQ